MGDQGIGERFFRGLARSRQGLTQALRRLVGGRGALDAGFYQELEGVLLGADLGVQATSDLLGALRERAQAARARPDQVVGLLGELLIEGLGRPQPLQVNARGLTVVMAVGVNGSGKTTTLAKLAHRYGPGRGVLMAAADTFRAAAADQLEVWARRAGAQVVRHQEGSDPAAVVFDAISAARARGCSLVLVDTAGRLQTKHNLMQELEKIRRVAGRAQPGAPHEVLLVLDATTGQNALSQARLFLEAAGVTGVVLAKLDGTARGGVVFAITRELGLPVKFVGLGEGLDDLESFDPQAFVAGLLAGCPGG